MKTLDYLRAIGVADLPPRTTPFDPGYDSQTLKQHLRQSSHLMAGLKLSMACWQIAEESVTREKVAACREFNIPVCVGGGPLEVAAHFGKIDEYLSLCADIGVHRIEAGEGFIKNHLEPEDLVAKASAKGLEVQFELGEKHAGAFDDQVVDQLLRQGQQWLDAGARQLVIEARESAQGVGLFDESGTLNVALAQRFIQEFGEERTIYEAPIKKSQFALIDFFGNRVFLGNIRLEELLRLEIYRRGLHSDAFQREHLRPAGSGDVQAS